MRTIIEKYQRLTELRSRYDDQIKDLAKKQLEIMTRVIKEFKLDHSYDYRDYVYYDWLEMSSDGDGTVALWERGRCGDSDNVLRHISIDAQIIKGDYEGFEQYYRTTLQKQADAAAATVKREAKAKRTQLEKELTRLNAELSKLDS